MRRLPFAAVARRQHRCALGRLQRCGVHANRLVLTGWEGPFHREARDRRPIMVGYPLPAQAHRRGKIVNPETVATALHRITLWDLALNAQANRGWFADLPTRNLVQKNARRTKAFSASPHQRSLAGVLNI